MNEPEKRTTPLSKEEQRAMNELTRMIIGLHKEREEQDYEMGEVDVDQDGH